VMRRQLTLLVPPPRAEPIETVRRLVAPVRHRLIATHVTLARDDGPVGFDARLLHRLSGPPPVLRFAPPCRFGTHGLWMPTASGEETFFTLRAQVVAKAEVRAWTLERVDLLDCIALRHPPRRSRRW